MSTHELDLYLLVGAVVLLVSIAGVRLAVGSGLPTLLLYLALGLVIGEDALGVDAVTDADVVLVPALAVGADGARLGRGGGSYDRALARVPAGRPRTALLYDGELLPGVPAEPHDQRVSGVVTPSGARHLVDGGP